MDPRATTPHPFRQRHPLLVYVLCPPLAATMFVIALLALLLHLGGDALKAHLTADTVGAWRLGLQTLTLYLVPWMVCHHTLRNAQRATRSRGALDVPQRCGTDRTAIRLRQCQPRGALGTRRATIARCGTGF